MEKDEDKRGKGGATGGISLPLPSPAELRGRQSVRATFRLSEKAIEALSIVSVHLGIKQKSLFDHLLEDLETLHFIAERFQQEAFEQPERVQKTFVLSRKTLSCLEQVSRTYHAPRDALVEYSIQRLLPVIAKERERHRMHKEILGDLTGYVQRGEALLGKAKEMLGSDDPVFDKLDGAIKNLLNTYTEIGSFVKKSEIIENFPTG